MTKDGVVPPDVAPLLDGLTQLKLKYWKDLLLQDWPLLKPAEQQSLAISLKKWIATELAERHTAGIHRRIQDAKFIRNQTVDQFDFQYNQSTRAIEKDYLKLHSQIGRAHV